MYWVCEDFDRHHPIELGVLGFEDNPHTTGPDQPFHFIFADSTKHLRMRGVLQEVEVDAGVADKRLLVTESEFARVLRSMGREGNTLSALIATVKAAGANSVRTCAFLDKRARRQADVEVEFIGFTLDDDEFLVGYGLDLAGKYRNLPYVGVLRTEHLPG